VTVTTAEGTKTLDAIALNEADDAAAGLTADQRTARKRLRDFVASLTHPPAAGADTRPYAPAKVAAIATPWAAPDPAVPAPPEVAWPGPALPGDPVGKGLEVGCVVAPADTVQTVVGGAGGTGTAAKVNQATPWTSGGRRWSLRLRPLLPDERDAPIW
jgi:hypothetical protein